MQSPLYWEVLRQVENSDFNTQKRLLKTVLTLLRTYPVLVLGDREFHSPKLAECLDDRGVFFALRQKKDPHFQAALDEEYQVLKNLGFKPGISKFYEGILCNTGDGHPEDEGINVPNLNGKRILVVDDDDDALVLLSFILESYDVQVMTASSATDAMKVIKQSQPDLLIIDIAMPFEDGYSLIRKVRNLEEKQLREIRAIALTAQVIESGRTDALEAGFQTYLTKPFDPEELLTEVANLLRISSKKSF